MELNYYAIDYIRRVLSADNVGAPRTDQAGQYREVLTSLYDVHKAGGAKTARMVWETTIAKQRPDVFRYMQMVRHLYTVDQLSEIPMPRYLLEPYPVYEGLANLLVGARGTGKSFFAIDMACRAAQAGRRVLYIVGEGLDFYHARIEAWHDYHQLAPNRNLNFYGHPVSTKDDAEFDAFFENIFRAVQAEFVIVDTVARSMEGMDENNSTDMKRFVSRWDRLKWDGATLLFIHHTNRMGNQRGSGVLDDAVDAVMVLQRMDEAIALRNDFEAGGKNRGKEETAPLYFQIQKHEVGRYTGDDAAAVLVKVDKKTIELGEVGKLNERQLGVLRVLSGIEEGLTASELCEQMPDIHRVTVYRQLNALTKQGYVQKRAGMYTLTDKGQVGLDSNGGGE